MKKPQENMKFSEFLEIAGICWPKLSRIIPYAKGYVQRCGIGKIWLRILLVTSYGPAD